MIFRNIEIVRQHKMKMKIKYWHIILLASICALFIAVEYFLIRNRSPKSISFSYEQMKENNQFKNRSYKVYKSDSDTLISVPDTSAKWSILHGDECIITKNLDSNSMDTIFIEEHTKSDTTDEWFDDRYVPLSLVGPYLSYSYGYSGSGGAHPISGLFYKTINLNNKAEISLDQLFPREDIYSALLKDALIVNRLTEKDPGSLDELIDKLDGGCEISFCDILHSFYIKRIEGDTAEIEIGLRYGCEVMRENFTKLTIQLAIPKKINIMFLRSQFEFTSGKTNQTDKWPF